MQSHIKDTDWQKHYETARIKLLQYIHKPITHEVINDIHALVEPNKKHGYRDSFGTPPVNTYLPPQGINCKSEMEHLLNWYEDPNLSYIEVAARLHWGLVKIHPFYDGNGRTARLLVDLILLNNGKDIDFCKQLENYFISDKNRYCCALKDEKNSYWTFDITVKNVNKEWLNYFNEAFKSININK